MKLARIGWMGMAVAMASLAHAEPLPVANLTRDTPVNFQDEVLPFLRKNCLACHNETKAKAGLVLETPETILKGGDSGPAVIPGKGAESFLFQTSAHIEDPIMPPDKNKSKAENLTPDQLAILKLWIDQGAKGSSHLAAKAPETWLRVETQHPIYTVAISPDGRYAACGRGHAVDVYDLRRNVLAATMIDPELPGKASHRDFVHSLAFSPDGTLASGEFRAIKLWRQADALPVSTAAALPEYSALADSKNGEWQAIGGKDGSIKLSDLAVKDAKPAQVKDHAGPVTALAFTPDGSSLISASADKTLRRRALAKPEVSQKIDVPAPIVAMVLIEGGTRIAFSGADNIIRIVDVKAFDAPAPAAPAAPAPATPAAPAPAAGAPAPAAGAPAPAAGAPAPAASAPTPPAAPAPAVPAPPAIQFVELPGHTKPASILIAQDDKKQLLSAGEDALIKIWDVPGKKMLSQISPGAPVTQLKASPDGAKVAVLHAAGPAKVYQTADAKLLATLAPFPLLPGKVEDIKQEEALATRLSALYNAEIPKLEEAWKKEGEAADLAGKEVPKARQLFEDKLVEADKKRQAKARADHDAAQKEAAKDPKLEDAKKAATKAAEELATAESDLANAKRGISLAERNRELAAKLTGEAARKLADAKARKATADATLEAFKAKREAIEKQIADETPKIALTGLVFSADGTQISTATKEGILHRYLPEGAYLESLETGEKVAGIELNKAGQLVIRAEDRRAVTWNVDRPWTLAGRIGDGANADILVDRVTALAFSADGANLVSGSGVPSRSGILKIWDARTLEMVAENPDAHSDTISGIAFNAAGDKMVTGSTDRFVKVFDAATGEHLKSFEAHTGHVLGVDWSPDDRMLVSSAADMEVKFWNFETGEQIRTLKGWEKEVTSVSFINKTTESVLTTSGDKTIKIDTAPLTGSEGFLYAAKVSRDGKYFVAGGEDGKLRVWTAADRKLVQTFEPPAKPSLAAAK